MPACQLIPEDLADIPPGPQLSAVLAGLDLATLSGFDCVEVLKAQYRQVSHERARLMAAMAEVGLCGRTSDGPARMAVPDEFSADEIRAALALTRRAADAQFDLAYDLISRLPAAHAAMTAGRLDEPRARVLSEWTAELSPEQARGVCDALLPRAEKLTTGQLIEQIKKMAIAIDPAWAQRRYEQAVAERKVVGYRNPDGSANLSGLNLPVDRVAAACGHIDALAKAAKQAGDSRPIDHIRADLFLGMTDGTYAGLDDQTIVERLHGHPDSAPEHESHDVGSGGSGSDDGGVTATKAPGGTDDPGAAAGPRGAGMELRARLSTLLGHDECPGDLSGWGPIHAPLTRDLATLMARGEWRFAITDEHGQLLLCGITTARPAGSARRSVSSREIVELQIPAATLRKLTSDPDTAGRWAPVLTDLARQYTSAQGHPDGDPTRRFPGSALRRYIQIRDRHCIMIGCRASARSTDADHTLDDAHGGTTTTDNLGSICRHDHRLKHDGGWRLEQVNSGHFHWISRLGHTYQVHPPPIIEPLPNPIPRDGPASPLLVPPDDELAIWDDTLSGGDTTPSTQPLPQPDPDDYPPPF